MDGWGQVLSVKGSILSILDKWHCNFHGGRPQLMFVYADGSEINNKIGRPLSLEIEYANNTDP